MNQVLSIPAVTLLSLWSLTSAHAGPPGAVGDLYVASTGSGGVLQYDGDDGTSVGEFASCGSPRFVTFGSDGHLYVSKWSGIVARFNGNTGQYIDDFATGLGNIEAIAFGPNGNLFVAGWGGSVMERSGSDGSAVRTITHADLNHCVGLLFTPSGDLLASNAGENIVEFTFSGSDWTYVRTLSSAELAWAGGMDWGPDGNLYIADNSNGRAVKYVWPDGPFSVFTSGDVSSTYDLTYGPDNNLYLSSYGYSKVVRFNGTSGTYIDDFVTNSSGGLSSPVGLTFKSEPQAAPDVNCEDLADHDFGSIPAGLCGAEHTWTVTNEATGGLTGVITLEGADPNEFEFTQGGGAFALAADESVIVGVRFCPTSESAKSATLRITSNDPDEDPCDLNLDGVGTPTWWDLDWGYRKQIIIDHTLVDDDLVSFPVLVSHTSADFPGHAQEDGDDFVFTDESATPLDHEIELYDYPTGELSAWVNVPALSSSVNTTLYVYYGNPSCGNQENVTGVWDADYIMVHHLTEDGTATRLDSTSYANDAAAAGAPASVTAVIGTGNEFFGTDDFLSVAYDASLALSHWTITAWVKPDNAASSQGIVTRGVHSFDHRNYALFIGEAGTFGAVYEDENGVDSATVYTPAISAGEWYCVTTTHQDLPETRRSRIYLDGVIEDENLETISPRTTQTSNLAIGNYNAGGWLKFDGILDEIRMSRIERSAEWISTSYNTMDDPNAFMTIGAEEEPGGTNADVNCEDLTGFDFGAACTGECSLEHTWTVTNEGADPLAGSIDITGVDADQFVFTQGDGAFALNPDESLSVGVQFCPQTLGSKSAILRINSSDPDEDPCDLALDGTGGCPDINCEDLDDYDWGTIPGECSDIQYWTVINEGTATLNGTNSFTGPDAEIFEFTEGGGSFALEPTEELTVGVRFCCDSPGAKSATFQIDSDDPDESLCEVLLDGTCPGFTIGGAVYADLDNPLNSGEQDVLINVDGDNGNFETTTAGMMGLWQIAALPPGTYSVDATKLGCTFEHVVGGVPGDPPPIEITVDAYHEAENQSIQFLATCTPLVPDLNCEDLAEWGFGDVDVSECSTEHAWTLTNEGTATLSGSIWLDGDDPEQFDFTQGGGDFTLEPSQSQDVKVRFCPLSVGAKTAFLHIVSNDPDENPCDAPLEGTGIGVPDLNCEDLASYDYGSIVVYLCSAEHTWSVENEGTATLSGTISLTGTDPDQFVFTQGDGPFDLDPGQALTVEIRFCPDSVGVKSATLHIDSNDPDENPCDLALDGEGIPPNVPEINCEDLSDFNFGSKTVGYCTVEQTWILINEGEANLTGTIFLAGDNADEFEFTRGGGGFGLGPGAQRIIGVWFCPQTVGAKVATLEIESNDGDENPCVLALSGTGGECTASRDLAATWPSYCDGAAKLVEINLDVPPGTLAISLEDQLPTGWTASNISNNGVWDPAFNSVKWAIDLTFPDQVSYDALPPPDTSGVHCFDGVISIDGGPDDPVCGDECLDGPAGAFIPADSPQPPCPSCGDCSCATCEDRQVEGCESSGYVCAWRSGCNDDMAGATRSAYIWTHGECYCWNSDDEMWYEVPCPPSTSGCCEEGRLEPLRGDGSADRTLPVSAAVGSWFPVLIDIEPPPGVSVVALEDQPPTGWEVQAISDNGVWDEIHGKVKWGPYYYPNIPSQVGYEALPPLGTMGQHCFNGAVSFDGFNQSIEGDSCMHVGMLGDVDYDEDLDLADFAGLQQCFGESPVSGGCSAFDFDGDNDVDTDDFDAWAQTMTGPNE